MIGICDDEDQQIRINGYYIKTFAEQHNYDIHLFGFCSASKLMEFTRSNALDILLLDIDMGTDLGIQIAQKLFQTHPNTIIIFLTSHSEYTKEAFDVESMGYIIKPVNQSKLERTFGKAIVQIDALKNIKPFSSLIITEENTKKKINQADILYIERQQSKSIIFTASNIYRVYETISSLYNRLEATFLRINQHTIVNMNEIDKIKHNSVYLKSGLTIPIGKTFRKIVLESYLNLSFTR